VRRPTRMQANKVCPKCKLEHEGALKLICNSCNAKRTQLSRMFGRWPIEVYDDLPDDAQTLLWQSDAKSKSSLASQLITHVTNERVKKERELTGGKYFPLSVYKSQGYEEAELANIEAHCKFEDNADLNCRTYLLDIKEVVTERVRKEVVTMVSNLRTSTLSGRLSHYASPPPKKLKRKRSKSSSSSKSRKSSKSSSSSSKSPTPKQKAAKVIASKKAAAAAAKEATAANAKAKKISEQERKVRFAQFKADKKLALEQKAIEKRVAAESLKDQAHILP
jgi:hypothetical protein